MTENPTHEAMYHIVCETDNCSLMQRIKELEAENEEWLGKFSVAVINLHRTEKRLAAVERIVEAARAYSEKGGYGYEEVDAALAAYDSQNLNKPQDQRVLAERDQWVRDSPEPYVPFADRNKAADLNSVDHMNAHLHADGSIGYELPCSEKTQEGE